MLNTACPFAHPTLEEDTPAVRPFTVRTVRRGLTFKVVDPLTGEPRYFRHEETAECYATRLEIADALAGLE
jgi:hypothetical protein